MQKQKTKFVVLCENRYQISNFMKETYLLYEDDIEYIDFNNDFMVIDDNTIQFIEKGSYLDDQFYIQNHDVIIDFVGYYAMWLCHNEVNVSFLESNILNDMVNLWK